MKFRWDRKYLYWGITAFVVVACSMIFYWMVKDWNTVFKKISDIFTALSPVLYAFVFSFLLAPICNFLEDNFFIKLGRKLHKKNEQKAKRFARAFSVTGSVLFGVLLVAFLLYLIIPQTYSSIQSLVESFPGYVDTLITKINSFTHNKETGLWHDLVVVINSLYNSIIDMLKKTGAANFDTLLTGISAGVISVFRVLFSLIVGLVMTVYLLAKKEHFLAQLKKLTYCIFKKKTANNLLKTASLTYDMFGNYISARLVDSLIIGVLTYVCMLVLRLPYPVLISVIVGITNIIPFFGPFVGAIPSALLILLVSPIKCFIFIVLIVVIQQLDGNVIGPLLLGNTTGLNSFWVLVSLLIGGTFGFVGIICSVPLFAVVYTLVKAAGNSHLERVGLPDNTLDYYNLSSIDLETGEPIYKVEHNSLFHKGDIKYRRKKKQDSEKKED